MTDPYALPPFHPFRFQVDFNEVALDAGGRPGAAVPLCGGAFSEVSGLEATMEAKVIKEGGKNYGVNQRAGQVSFATVILKRGMTRNRDLWRWFSLVGNGAYAYRLSATITMSDPSDGEILAWRLDRALPVKFKAADLNARASEVAIEELHIAHEGLSLVSSGRGGGS